MLSFVNISQVIG